MTSAAGQEGQCQLLPSTLSGGTDLWVLGCHERNLVKRKPSCWTPSGKTTWGQTSRSPCCSRPALGASSASPPRGQAFVLPAPHQKTKRWRSQEEGPCWAQTPSREIQWVLLCMCLLTCYTERENQKRLNLNQSLRIQKCIKKVESSRKTPLPPSPANFHRYLWDESRRGEGRRAVWISHFMLLY